MINFIDIFAGCGGISEGFKQHGAYNMLAAVEWEKPQVENLRHHLVTHWGITEAHERVLHFDIQRTEDLLNGWDEQEYGKHSGLKHLVGNQNVDLIIGGPPCQAYSLAARIGYGNQMKHDYRNYLFESYMRLVKQFQPKMFVFENVLGMLSAKVGDGKSVINLIKKDIEAAGYAILDDLRTHAVFNMVDYGVPQKRKRVIIVGIKKDLYDDPQQLLHNFYTKVMPTFKESTVTVRQAIGDLESLCPIENFEGKRSHSMPLKRVPNHLPRYHNPRDIKVFNLLANDIKTGENRYITTNALKQLYTELTGRKANIHKYHVLRWDEPSNTIPAHLYKDGLRHIHPDPLQGRSITVREAARLQSFPDEYEFITSMGDNYKMIGNAVPPKFARKIAHALFEYL